jgi:hypothetical protein
MHCTHEARHLRRKAKSAPIVLPLLDKSNKTLYKFKDLID